MKVFVTGADGQLGHDVINELSGRGHYVIGSDIHQKPDEKEYISLDITDRNRVMNVIKSLEPDAVIHCAAWTAVDDGEDTENRERVFNINAAGTENIAEACAETDCTMMYISTDYVFGGEGEMPWDPDCRHFAPLNVYGQSKLEGERAVAEHLRKFFIVRTSWLFGISGSNFVNTMLRIGKTHDEIRVVNDQVGTPAYAHDLAGLLADMIETDRYGYYHATNDGGYISFYDFACEIFRQAGYDTRVIPVTTEEYGLSKAIRPLNSRLDKSKLTEAGFELLPDWKDAVQRYIMELKEIE